MRRMGFIFIGLAFCGQYAFARIAQHWDYDALREKADLIVIAKPSGSKDLKERTNLTENIRPPVPVIGMETAFEVRTILKGALKEKKLTLHHYRLGENVSLNGPLLVAFTDENGEYLMFLKIAADGRYVPVAGQVDPAAD